MMAGRRQAIIWTNARILLIGAWGINISYFQISNISRTSIGNKIYDNSEVVGASPVGAAPTTSSFST